MLSPFLFCTDFDGTLLSVDKERKIADEFYDLLLKKKIKNNFIWVINTGRSWESLLGELQRLRIPFCPDWVVLYEKEVYKVNDFDIYPLEEWNSSCRTLQAVLFDSMGFFFDELSCYLNKYTGAKIHGSSCSPVEIEASSSEEADQIAFYIDQKLRNYPSLTYHRNFVYFRFAHKNFHKGSALKQIQSLLDINPQNSMVCGDHFNDLPMLDLEIASYLACPANAIEEVKEKVAIQGGYIANKEASLGIIEALLNLEEQFSAFSRFSI
ncbi:HAD family hydrolase [Methylacidiphilum caldifontis]|uniref:Haloacid dehalogenase n=1 Tax=Methylacidiphilum caldifontis TaxID=2795386 RepID=A0A4Y8PGL3_9BACT|nr:HAD hydrolase family protein [Methylacidiphilum caldifontis]QSR88433.1 HAD family phosphatase [Methylacidiphilum caldifontis]TFE71262.1 haloacid dehalogenase [Methylacidiphilum caldifontis]